jgi:hypothetical protein
VNATDDGLTAQGFVTPRWVVAELVILVTDLNEAPVVADKSVAIPENLRANLPLNFSVSAIDPDNTDLRDLQTLVFSIESGNSHGAFGISESGAVKVARAVLDYEGLSMYNLTIRVTDNGPGRLFGLGYLVITLEDRNDAPYFQCNADPDFADGTICSNYSVFENSPNATEVGSLLAFDEDSNPRQDLTFTIFPEGSTDGALDRFVIDSEGLITVLLLNNTWLNFEAVSVYVLDIGVSDGDVTVKRPFHIGLIDVNEQPILTDGERSVSNDAGPGDTLGLAVRAIDPDAGTTLVYSLIGGNTTLFGIDNTTGQLSVTDGSGQLSFMTANDTIFVRVHVTDGELSDNCRVGVAVEDQNFSPDIEPGQGCSIDENSAVDTICTRFYIFGNDSRDPNDNVRYSLENASPELQALFGITNVIGKTPDACLARLIGREADPTCQGRIYLKEDVLDFEQTNSYTVPVTIWDVPLDPTFRPLSATVDVLITIIDMNDPPTVSDVAFTVDENSDGNTFVGLQQWADEDDDILDFSIVGGDAAEFEVRRGTGRQECEVYVKANANLNFEVKNDYYIIVEGTDNGPNGIVQSRINITVLDVNEWPTLVINDMSIPEDGTVYAGDVLGADPDSRPGYEDGLFYTILTYRVVDCQGVDYAGTVRPIMDYTVSPPLVSEDIGLCTRVHKSR